MEIYDNVRRAEAKAVSKAEYRKPVLTVFGLVRELTQSTSTICSGDGTGVMMMNSCVPSDPSIKENVVRVGTHRLGIGLYLFDYMPEFRSFGEGRQFGVMADEVERVMPAAVSIHATGDCKQVNYAMLGIERAVN